MKSAHWLDDPRHVKLLWRLFLLVLAATVLAELVVEIHPHFEIESVFGFHAWFGLLTCAAMIGLAKGLALWLKRPDTYYGHAGQEPELEPEPEHEHEPVHERLASRASR